MTTELLLKNVPDKGVMIYINNEFKGWFSPKGASRTVRRFLGIQTFDDAFNLPYSDDTDY